MTITKNVKCLLYSVLQVSLYTSLVQRTIVGMGVIGEEVEMEVDGGKKEIRSWNHDVGKDE